MEMGYCPKVAKLDLSSMEWVQTSNDRFRRLIREGQLTNLSISLTPKAAQIASLDVWLRGKAVYCLVEAVEAENNREVDCWINLKVLPSMPNPFFIKPVNEAIEYAREHVQRRRPSGQGNKDVLRKS